jgi:uncharacterized protein YecA (UPF0149 family)
MNFLERIVNYMREDKQKDEPGRNESCWCGSGKKYKRCHLGKNEEKRRRQGGLA